MTRTPSIWIPYQTAESLNLADAFKTWGDGYGRNVRRTPKFNGVGADLLKGMFEPGEIDDPDYRYFMGTFGETKFYTVTLGGKKVAVEDTRNGWQVDEILTDLLKDAGVI